MKIEKLTENKIRIILNQNDLEKNITKLSEMDFQILFIKILNKAKKEINFNVEGCKLFIESYSSPDNAYIFTITKMIKEKNSNFEYVCKSTNLKKVKTQYVNNIFVFNSFENFESFCYLILSKQIIDLPFLYKKSMFYFYNNKYFLILKKINIFNKSKTQFYSLISEFCDILSYSENYEAKLNEYGKLLIKNNVLDNFKKHFYT